MNEFSQRLTDLSRPLRVHLVGVAGSGMSGLALLLLGMGHRVSGSDRVTSAETERMQGLGLRFSTPHTPEEVEGADVVVYSSAIRPDNPALASARDQGIRLMRRAECLAAILHTKKGIVVSGTHGKTTTSSMVAHALREAAFQPSHYVGAEIPVLGQNARWNEDGDWMVAEGDESDGTLALYQPACSIVLNVEAEHLDHYRNLDEIKEVFRTLIHQTSGPVVYCAADAGAFDVCSPHVRAVSYGWENADYTVGDIRELRGTTAFTVFCRGRKLGEVELGIPGRHNVLNALAAIATCDSLGADFQLVSRALNTFAGARRRFETKYLSRALRIVDDYGHHPTEIAATLQTARQLKPKRVVVLFQPHRYTRTQALADDFGRVLAEADEVFVTDIYPASETPIPGVTGQTIVDAVKRHGGNEVESVPDLQTAHHRVGNSLEPGDLLITLGAGNVHEAGRSIARDFKILEEMAVELKGGEVEAKLYEPMRRHSTMLVGGPAQFWLEPHTFDAFASVVNYCRERGMAIRVVGRGSNLLVRDGGIRGAVIHPKGGQFDECYVNESGQIVAGAGVRLKKLAGVARSAGIGGFEWMEGIPGNVGGALRMNAGAMGVETFQQVVRMTSLDEDGEIRTRERGEIEVHYRNVPELRRNFALQAVFAGVPDSADQIDERWEASRLKRRSSQPLAASAGCIFKNPSEIPAGMLVDQLGFKGRGEGKAEVSLEHGNFIVNRGGATAAEVLAVIENIRREAREKRGIELETEVKVIGEDEYTF
ncbi:UDP-N-acetylmuramate--L-alanine ligase/UDP-N-acetylenolpyruvoylglucosamine reductase [Haloferula luteola]|uniref:Multifunctional fusion protein n=1 Tax=Haloferula luteola TaxID=595692 RepID=A0A840V2W7_9BACT|nr:UDP-N-acetylmuramate--L-alanine ligase [Haloferula luteola]MBB5352332.1 UDP-N-acetylmuramate--L-alanine ligase/UDP-N-acetylenolpyruvoylglucosamine reductase [Haloferula luteola]